MNDNKNGRVENTKTRGTAFAVLQEEFRSARRSLESDEPGISVVDESLLKDVFQVAWKNQFDDDRGEFRAQVREIVEDAVAESSIEGG